MLSWARVIDSFEAVPEIYRDAYQALAGNTGLVPYAVLAPAQASPRISKSSEKLLCEISGALYVLERVGEAVVTTGYRYQDVCSFELGNILLYSQFSISGRTTTGAESTLTVEFNEATLRHFEPFFSKMRPLPAGPDPSGLQAEQAKFNFLSTENFKFMNFARERLVRGEKVIQTLYQPQNRQKLITVLGHSFYRTRFLAHLTILTDKEVILIRDDERITEKKRSRYGGVWRFLPLHSLVSVTLKEIPNDLLSVTFHLASNIQVERFFDAPHLHEIENLKKTLEALPA